MEDYSGLPHYKQKSRIFGSQSRLRDSKPRNNALHAFCGIETIELPPRSSHKKSVFEPRPAPSRQYLRISVYNAEALEDY